VRDGGLCDAECSLVFYTTKYKNCDLVCVVVAVSMIVIKLTKASDPPFTTVFCMSFMLLLDNRGNPIATAAAAGLPLLTSSCVRPQCLDECP
jgi:hypothetical protein